MKAAALPISRRDFLAQGGATLAVLALAESALFAQAWGAGPGETTIPFLDSPPPPPRELVDALGTDLSLLDWQRLDSWITPNDKFFRVAHYGFPQIDASSWKLEIAGWVANPRRYTLDQIKGLAKKEIVFALECSGNSGFPWFQGGIGNARWAGAPLASVLKAAGVKKNGIEVIFSGADVSEETLAYIDGMGNRVEDIPTKQSFARSMSLEEAMDPDNLLCYEMNGQPLPRWNGFPVRLIAPRWYGIANVKWLTRIEVADRRFLGTFMADRYVTVHEEPQEGGGTIWRRSSVGKSRLKSIPAKVTVGNGRHRIYGAAWGAPVARVEVRVDDGAWMPAEIGQGKEHPFAWKFWHRDWPARSSGEHRITSRAIDSDGNIQPSGEDPFIAGKHTYWESNAQATRRIRIP
jgi:DMSO/TMAO reductase YedYZ molybdopterin-dependent catalytic subunit